MSSITWREEKRHISALKAFKNNPRRLSSEKYNILKANILASGYMSRLIINTENMVLGGNQRLKALKELGYTEIDVLVPNIPLSPEQENRINISDNISAGDWDFDVLGNLYEPEQLVEWGMPSEWLLGEKPEEAERKPIEKKIKQCPSCGELLN